MKTKLAFFLGHACSPAASLTFAPAGHQRGGESGPQALGLLRPTLALASCTS